MFSNSSVNFKRRNLKCLETSNRILLKWDLHIFPQSPLLNFKIFTHLFFSESVS